MSKLTRILSDIERGGPDAGEKRLRPASQELRKLVAADLSKEKPGQTLQLTMLLPEVCVRLIKRARRKQSEKHGGALRRVELDVAAAVIENPVEDLLALDAALTWFQQPRPDKARLMKLKYIARLTISEAAQALGISTTTAERYWKFARAWLHSELKSSD